MELYDELASNDESRRVAAAGALVNRILEGQRSESDLEKGMDLTYALGRLIKGLSSGRESARLGFSVALTELLSELQNVDIDEILGSIEKYTTPSGSISGMVQTQETIMLIEQEERDFLFGRLFGLGALIHSNILFKPNTPAEVISAVIKHLISLMCKKPWMREPAANELCKLIEKSPQLNNGKSIAEEIFRNIEENKLLRSQDGAAVLLALNELPKHARPKLSNKIWQHGDPLHPFNMTLLNNVLKDIPSEGDTVKQSGIFRGEPHFIWTLIQRRYAAQSRETVGFKNLWDTVVDNGFFASSSSLERKYRGFQMFTRFLASLPEDLISILFTENFLRCLVNQSTSEDRYLNKAAKKALSTIHTTCEAKPTIIPQVYRCLVGYSTRFDRLTKLKTVEELYPLINSSEQLVAISEFLMASILNQGDVDRKWLADQLIVLARQASRISSKDNAFIKACIKFLCKHGFFVGSIAESERSMLREKLFSLVAIMTSDSSEIWPAIAVLEIKTMEKEYKRVVKLDSEIKTIRKAALKTLRRLRSTRMKNDSRQHRGLETLFALALLQLYNGDPQAVSVLEELQSYYETIANEADIHQEQLVEVVLGFLSKPSTLLRKLSEQVFASFASDMTSTSLKLLFDVLLTPETTKGAEELFDRDTLDTDGEGDSDSEDSGDQIDEDEGEEGSGEDNEDGLEDGMDIESGDADEELDAALSEALGTKKEVANGVDEDGLSDSESMDDDEMLALDKNLANIFRQRLKPDRAKEAKDTKEQIATFKCKVIDLLEIVVKERNDLSLEMILPLLQASRITKSDTVHSKTINLLRKLSKSKELSNSTHDPMDLLRKIHEDAAKAKAKDGNIHSQLSIYVARIARKQGREEEVIGVYAETMRKWIKNGKSMVRTALFADWLNWCQSIRR